MTTNRFVARLVLCLWSVSAVAWAQKFDGINNGYQAYLGTIYCHGGTNACTISTWHRCYWPGTRADQYSDRLANHAVHDS